MFREVQPFLFYDTEVEVFQLLMFNGYRGVCRIV